MEALELLQQRFGLNPTRMFSHLKIHSSYWCPGTESFLSRSNLQKGLLRLQWKGRTRLCRRWQGMCKIKSASFLTAACVDSTHKVQNWACLAHNAITSLKHTQDDLMEVLTCLIWGHSQQAETVGTRQEEVIARYRRSPSPKGEVMSSRWWYKWSTVLLSTKVVEEKKEIFQATRYALSPKMEQWHFASRAGSQVSPSSILVNTSTFFGQI